MKGPGLRELCAAVVLTFLLLSGCVREPRVLLFMRAVPHDPEYTRTHEVEVMRSLLEKAGLRVVVAAPYEVAALCSCTALKTDLLLKDVMVSEYAGFLLPDMGTSPEASGARGVEMVKQAAAQGKPIAAQHGSINLLSQAGLLKGKHYAYQLDVFPEGICDGPGVVQDGLIITSGTDPGMAERTGRPDCTVELTRKLIAAVVP
jgi:putative intracellular protease/amidase